MAHIFISYSRKDLAYVLALASALKQYGVPVWYDSELTVGEPWWQKLQDQIKASAAVLLVMSPNSQASAWVQREIQTAQNAAIPITPVLIAGEPWAAISDIHHLDLRTTKAEMPPAALVDALRNKTQPPEPPRPKTGGGISIGSITAKNVAVGDNARMNIYNGLFTPGELTDERD